MTDIIRKIIKDKYDLFNVNEKKEPVIYSDNSNYTMLCQWGIKSYAELVSNHNYKIKQWGLRLGLQSNQRRILSLDFDICGKKNSDGIRVGCNETKLKYDEYIKIKDRDDGLFSSSTSGNFNLLIDYTDCPQIIEYIVKINSSKFKFYELEILLGISSACYQVIPPTKTKCKITGVLGEKRNFINGIPFYNLLENTSVYNFIVELFETKLTPCKKILTIIKKKQDIVKTDNLKSESKEMTDKYIDLLFNVIDNKKDSKGCPMIDWDEWFQIAGILKSNNYDKDIFIKYSNILYNDSTEANKLWDGINKSNMQIGGLINLAKKHNMQGYKNWEKQNIDYLNLEILQKGENDVAKFIAPILIKNLVYCRNDWWEFNFTTFLWGSIKDPSAAVTNCIQSFINKGLEYLYNKLNKCNEEEERIILLKNKDLYNTFYSDVCKSSYNSQVIKYLKTYLCDNTFYDKLDDGLYKMVYKNGILDIKTLIFKKGIEQTDYITQTIPFNFETPDTADIEYVKENIKKICNYNDSHLDYFLSAIGYAMTGDSSKEQMFWYLRGQTADNGKSIIFETLEKLMPNYVTKATSDVLDKGADLRKEIATWKGLKLLWLNEMSIKPKDEDRVKALCDGTGYKYNRLYSTDAIVMPITFKLFTVSNNTLTIKGDAGIKRRFKLGQFNSQFKEDYEDDYENLQFKKDKEFSNKLCNQYKNALIYLILTYANKYYIDKKILDYPAEWNDEADEVINENNKFEEWFLDIFEINEETSIHKKIFEDIIANSSYKTIKIKDEFKRMKIKCSYDSQKQEYKDGIRSKGFWIGFSLKN